jgi:hypothetical protein
LLLSNPPSASDKGKAARGGSSGGSSEAEPAKQIGVWVQDALAETPIYDLHTHLYPASFGPLMLWGIDELLTYHYLIAESIRAARLPYERYWAMSQQQQAEFIWQTLFIERAPISEACRGIVTALHKLGLDVGSRNLADYRKWYAAQKPAEFVSKVLAAANVQMLAMTNDVFDAAERQMWLKGATRESDPRFKAVLRIDPLLLGWPAVGQTLRDMGYDAAGSDMGAKSMQEVRRFLTDWIERIGALYVAVSLDPTWTYPATEGRWAATTRVIQEAILPVCRERNVPFALMIGVRRQVNPQLRLAGDASGKAGIESLERLCVQNPANKFMCTMLSREDQHELCVTARKNPNLFIFGCWWFLNNPSLVEEITRMRMELLGTSFAPQHSDARILDQLVYKWDHSRAVIGKVLTDKFNDLARAGWPVTQEEVQRTVRQYFGENFTGFLK